jgi:hypothetical protein
MMVWFRKWMILIHRYLGIVLSLVFVTWFVSGIAMMYARDMPGLTPEARMERLPALDLERVWLTPSQAAEGASLGLNPGRVVLLTVMDRPAYRFSGRETVTVFAETGERLVELGEGGVVKIAGSFMDLPREALRHAGVLTEPDQWTIGVRDQMPLHKIVVDDDARTELYVSTKMGEVVVLTTRATRALAWVAAIPHWFYFAPLRLNGPLWRQVVIWTAGLGAILALIGIILGVIQFAPSRPFQWKRIGSYIPYSGWMRWHYITGVIFGILTFTWVFSGMLSMEPWGWASGGGTGDGIPRALSGGPADPADFPAVDAAAWKEALEGRSAREVAFVRIQGDPYYLVRGVEEKPLLVSPNQAGDTENLFDTAERPLEIKREPFSIESVMSRVKEGNPDAPIVESELLSEYDSYYYSFDGARPLPVLRIKFGDPDSTWFYIDPHMSQVTGRVTRIDRVERWIYNGFHSLDFSFWYYNRPLWYLGVIVLSIGCIASSAIGFYLGMKRVFRYARRTAAFVGDRIFP